MTKRICIIGLAKSGTSALYSTIKEQLPAPRRLMFEPGSVGELAYAADDNGKNTLTKLMFLTLDRFQYDPRKFTHNIAIVRDPRDVLVSTILFQFNKLEILNNKPQFMRLVELLEQKENAPRDVSIVDILTVRGEEWPLRFRKRLQRQLRRYADYLDLGQHHIITFDQMIAGEFDGLNRYLGLPLEKPKPLEGWISKISRKGESGDWKHWFNESDVTFFRQAIDPFLTKYGFSTEWELEENPQIEPVHCSEYISRLAKSRREDPNRRVLEGTSEEALLSAAEDGKVHALRHLHALYSKRGGRHNRLRATEMNDAIEQMGHPRCSSHRSSYLEKLRRFLRLT